MPGFNYSKWDRIELSDDEETHHPNLDKNLNIRVNRITRDRKEEEIDTEKEKLVSAGKLEQAERLENKRPLHVDNICHVAEERTIIQSSSGRKDTFKKGEESFKVDDYSLFKQDNQSLLDSFEKADWEESRNLLINHGDVLMEEYANSYYMLTALEEEMKGHRKKMEKLCKQGQIISQIFQLAEPMKRPPRDLVPRFFERFEGDASKAAFQEGVDHFKNQLIQRAIVKKQEEAKEEAEAAEEEQQPEEDAQPVSLVEAMYTMTPEERKGPGGLDPVEVFESLPETLQHCFKSGDVDMLKQVASSMDPAEFDNHFKRIVDAGLWSKG
mmetsp:Transcript_39330/g.112767  ORF Transcript_39330/g.112767 Transcript_39330/m.112767 type:complete len:326 (-) Transcript_39330:84-1061(-)